MTNRVPDHLSSGRARVARRREAQEAENLYGVDDVVLSMYGDGRSLRRVGVVIWLIKVLVFWLTWGINCSTDPD